MASPKKTKTQKVAKALDQAKEIGEIGKAIAPPKIDVMIDRGTQAIDVAQTGMSMFEKIKGIFRRGKR